MKRIKEYKKLFAVENEIDLKQLKMTYRVDNLSLFNIKIIRS